MSVVVVDGLRSNLTRKNRRRWIRMAGDGFVWEESVEDCIRVYQRLIVLGTDMDDTDQSTRRPLRALHSIAGRQLRVRHVPWCVYRD